MAGLADMETVSILSLIAGLLVFVLFWKWLNRPNYSRLPKSPPTLPLLGNLGIMLSGKPFCPTVEQISKDLGGCFTLWLGGAPSIFIADQKLASELFVNMPKTTSDRMSNTTILSVATKNYRGIAFRGRDKQHIFNRKLGSAALRDLFCNKNDHCAMMLDRECKRLLKNVTKAGENNKAVEPLEFLYQMTIRVISATVFGKDFIDKPTNVNRVRQLADFAFKWMDMKVFFFVHTIPLLRFVPFFNLNAVQLYAKARDILINGQIDEHRATLDPNKSPRDITDILLTSSEGKMDDDERVMVISDLIVAGSETVSTTLSWVILCLVRCPEWQVRLRDEIEGVVDTAEELSSVNMKSLPLLNAFYHEVQRWASPVAMSIMHVASEEISFGDYTIPKGTGISALFHLMHNDTKYWNNPRKFDPMRFINEEGEFAIPNKSFMSFSIGPRSCPGDSLAKREMFFALLYLVYHVTFLPEEEGKLPSTENYEQATLRPIPYKVRLRLERPLGVSSA